MLHIGEELDVCIERRTHDVVGAELGQEQTDMGIEFVHGAIGFQTDVGLRDALTAYKAGHAGIAGAGVERHVEE